MSAARTPKVLDIIRTAAADCTDTMARNELLDAAAIVSELLKTIDLVADGLAADARSADGMTKAVAVMKLAAVHAKATGAAS